MVLNDGIPLLLGVPAHRSRNGRRNDQSSRTGATVSSWENHGEVMKIGKSTTSPVRILL